MATEMTAAALAGVPAGVQSQGVWAGRRQLFVRFADEAETATMYTSAALARELERQLSRSLYHSVCIGGRDPLANLAFLLAALTAAHPPVPVMLDTDGQRPEALAMLAPHLALAQVTVDFVGPDATVSHAIETLFAAAGTRCAHALVLCPRDDTSDTVVLRTIERGHEASPVTEMVIHPPLPGGDQPMLDRRWATLLDQAVAMHANIRLALRIPPPAGLR
jgi:pyruvate-formate lyase-activating enzyme